MSKPLPSVIAAYFKASNAHDIAAMSDCFAEEAVVHDEEQKYHGIATISRWIAATTEKYQTTVEVTDINEQDGVAVVTGLVSGRFDGSPAMLRYDFTLAGGTIAALKIR